MRTGESEKDYTLGGSEREMGTPILNPLFSLPQVDSRPQIGCRDLLSRRPHREGGNTRGETKEGHWRFSSLQFKATGSLEVSQWTEVLVCIVVSNYHVITQ